jgi:hypothetical protein
MGKSGSKRNRALSGGTRRRADEASAVLLADVG